MEKITRVIQWFSQQSSFIKLNNKLNLNDINIHKEFEFMQILNLLYSYNLQSTNAQKSNYPAIDLIDNVNEIAIQVTSNTSIKKIKETLEKIKRTDFQNYKIIFLYLCDEISSNTRNKIKEFDCECLCFIDLIREFQNNEKAINEFLLKIEQKDIYQRLCEYLILPTQWDFDEKGAFCKLDPNFEIVSIYDEDLPNHLIRMANDWNWLNSINAISKHYDIYKNKTLPIQHIQIYYNQRKIYETFLYIFYGEGLTIATPSLCSLNWRIDDMEIYLESYVCCDNDFINNINSRLTYFYYILDLNQTNEKISFDNFINKKSILKYRKDFSRWIPIIFFKDQHEQNKFIEFAKIKIAKFNYLTIFKKYEYYLDKNWKNKDSLLHCCIHFWAYDLYWDCFKNHFNSII